MKNIFKFSKKLKFAQDAQLNLLNGANKLADAVQITLGPKGKNVLIEQQFGQPKITKDGVTVAKSIDLEDKFENIGANLIKQVSIRTNDEAGDGTTTATVLARAIFKEGVKATMAGFNPIEIKKGIDKSVQNILIELDKMTQQVDDKNKILQVATISANNDLKIGQLIADLIDKTGKHGIISVQDGKTLNHEVEFVEGIKFDRGYVSPYFVNVQKNNKVVFDNSLILITDKKVNNIQQILHIIEYSMQRKQPLLIIAEDFESELIATLVLNKLRSGLRICCVKAPAFGENRKNVLEDIAIQTGGQVITDDVGLNLEDCQPDSILGQSKQVEVSKDDSVIMNGNGQPDQIQNRILQIEEQIQQVDSQYDKEKLEERLSKFKGGVGVIKVGGANEVEQGEIKDRIEDAINATKAAINEGIVIGGGCALLHCSKLLDNIIIDNNDQQQGVEIIKKSIRIPCKQICENAGKEGTLIVAKLLEQEDNQIGYNAQNDEFINMFEQGIIDPKKVVRRALQDSSSVAGLMISSDCIVVENKEEKPQIPQDMGQMGM